MGKSNDVSPVLHGFSVAVEMATKDMNRMADELIGTITLDSSNFEYPSLDCGSPVYEQTQVVGWRGSDGGVNWIPVDEDSMLARLAPRAWPFTDLFREVGFLGFDNMVLTEKRKLFDVTVEYAFGTSSGVPPWPSFRIEKSNQDSASRVINGENENGRSRANFYFLSLGQGNYIRIALNEVVETGLVSVC